MEAWLQKTALALVALAAATSGCSTTTKKSAAKSVLESRSPETRRDDFEATTRALDEKPELIDEFYAVARQHPITMERFLANAARDLKNPDLATLNAALLVKEPESLEEVLVTTVDAAVKEPKARLAIDRAVAKRAGKMVDILTDDPATLAKVTSTSLATLQKKPRARENVLAAVRQDRAQVVAFVKSDPELAKEMTEELLREAVKDKPTLDKLLHAVGAIDDDHGQAKAKK